MGSIQNFVLEKMALPLADGLLQTNFISSLQQYRTYHNMPLQQLQTLQASKLQHLLLHATTNIPYYKNLGIQLHSNPYNSIKKFPILYKQNVTGNKNNLYTGSAKNFVVERSSGSSGIQGEVYMSKKESTQYQAAQTSLWEWSGYIVGSPIIQTGISPNRGYIKKVKDILFATQYINAYNINESLAIKALQQAAKSKKQFFGGYASSLYLYASIALQHNIPLPLQGVISWGDKLFDHYKTAIQQAFNNPIITELYGTTEGFVISGTCHLGNHHQLLPQTFLEIVDANGNEVADGEMGYVVVTRLDAYSFPLIRYYLGDLAIKAPASKVCTCGKPYPLIEKIIGRDTDIVQTPNGKFLIVHFFTGIFEHEPAIKQFRVIQENTNGITIEYIEGENFTTPCLEKLQVAMHQKAQEIFAIEWKRVEYIPATKSGKPQLIENRIAKKLQA
jgi:phenylacetate-CoA ligase